MTVRRALLLVFITVSCIALYEFAGLVYTSAGLLGFPTALDSWRSPVVRSSHLLGTIAVDIYESPRSRSTILMVHGVNESGKNSPELKPIAETLARSGFRVVVPEFGRMTRQNVT